MDLRIVNTCSNDCLYCLEQSYREKEKYLNLENILYLLDQEKERNILYFYWWNSLLHPKLFDIIRYAKKIWFNNVWILTNSFWITEKSISDFNNIWLNSFWIYFNSFLEYRHNLIVWEKWIKLDELLNNISLLSGNKFFVKIIIHINKQNINTIYKDVLILNKKYNINNFEFINYFPFDRPYSMFKKKLEYDIKDNKLSIDNLFKIIDKINIECSFMKFSKDFFWNNLEYYDYNKWVLDQIWEEDNIRINTKNKPYCLIEKRCGTCFIKDKCNWYEL